MSRILRRCIWLLLLLAPLWLQATEGGKVMVLQVDGAIGPATSDYLHRGLRSAEEANARLVIIEMNTPGGLDLAMRDIIQDILASPIPVVTYVSPSGSRAASAGTYILYASHIAAMAPGTNLGAATPVQIGGIPDPGKREPPQIPSGKPPTGAPGTDSQQDQEQPAPGTAAEAASGPGGSAMEHKMVNDAVAYIRSLAQLRGRNADWAEQAVREAASLSAREALANNVIDLVATSIPDLLQQLQGRELEINGQTITLNTEGLEIERIKPDWRSEILGVITDPNVAYILMLIGMYGLFFEFANPGYILPGVAGAICLILALFAFQVLPVNYAGLGLVILGIGFMLAEAFVPSFGVLGIGGVISFVIGSVILFDEQGGALAVSIPVIAAFAILSAGFFIGVLGLALKARERPVVSGREEMLQAEGTILADCQGQCRVRVHGEIWNARSSMALTAGQRVRVTGVSGLVLAVEPLREE